MKAKNRSTGFASHRLAALGRHARAFVAAAAAFVLAACSSIQLGYNNADTLLLYALDGYFDLDDAQEALVRARARALLDWHRATQLRDYAALIERVQSKLAGPIGAADVLAFQDDLYARLGALGERAAPDLAALALTLAPPQIERFADKLAHDTSKARRELVRFAGRESLDERVKRYAERAESWFGRLDARQHELIRSTLGANPARHQLWMDERQRRQQDLVAVLARIQRERPDEATAAQWLRENFARLAMPVERERAERVAAIRQTDAALIAQLINSATDEQRATLIRKLRGYAQDFTVLAASGERG
ncbi:MAG: hypothetical protein OHK0044_05520 [Burkholderiaceae bacterium]